MHHIVGSVGDLEICQWGGGKHMMVAISLLTSFKGSFTSSIMRQASLTQVWFTLVSMMLFTPSIMHQASNVTHTCYFHIL